MPEESVEMYFTDEGALKVSYSSDGDVVASELRLAMMTVRSITNLYESLEGDKLDDPSLNIEFAAATPPLVEGIVVAFTEALRIKRERKATYPQTLEDNGEHLTQIGGIRPVKALNTAIIIHATITA